MLLVGAGLFLASFARVAGIDLGFDPAGVVAVRVRPLILPAADTPAVDARNRAQVVDALARVGAMAGVRTAALASYGLPLRGDLYTVDVTVPGRVIPPGVEPTLNAVTPAYFGALGIPLVAGRTFTDADGAGSEPVVVLSELAARRLFGTDDVLGRAIGLGVRGRATAARVVGLVGNVRYDGPESAPRMQAFVPYAQGSANGATLVVRVAPGADASVVLRDILGVVASEFPPSGTPLDVDAATLDHYLGRLVAARRFNMLLLGLFGLFGLVIAALGIYGVMAYTVAQRAREFGIRLALGASPPSILATVFRRASCYVAIGLVIGAGGAWLLAGLVGGYLFQVLPHDPRVFGLAAVVLTAAGLAAAYVPARRAARVDPIVALRDQ